MLLVKTKSGKCTAHLNLTFLFRPWITYLLLAVVLYSAVSVMVGSGNRLDGIGGVFSFFFSSEEIVHPIRWIEQI